MYPGGGGRRPSLMWSRNESSPQVISFFDIVGYLYNRPIPSILPYNFLNINTSYVRTVMVRISTDRFKMVEHLCGRPLPSLFLMVPQCQVYFVYLSL